MFVDQVANEEDDERMTKNVPSVTVEAITSRFVNNIIKCLDEAVHPVTKYSQTYIVQQSDVTLE